MAYRNRRSFTELTAAGVSNALKLTNYAANRSVKLTVTGYSVTGDVRLEYYATAAGSLVAVASPSVAIAANGVTYLPLPAYDNAEVFVKVNMQSGTFTLNAEIIEETN